MAERKRKKPTSEEAQEAPASKKASVSAHQSPPEDEDQSPLEDLQLVPFDHESSSGLPDNLADLFIFFCPERLVDEWVRYLNEDRREYWHPTFREEIFLFFGMLLYMSCCIAPSIQDYWETSTHRAIHPIRKPMTRDRFLRIYRRFSTWDVTDNILPVYDGIKSWISSTKPSTSTDGGSDNNTTGTSSGTLTSPEPTQTLEIPLFVGAYTKKGKLNGIMDIGDQLRAQFQPQRIKKCHGKIPTFAFFFFFDIALTNTFFVQRRDWSAPTKVDSKPKFREELYAQLVDRFRLHVTLLRTRGTATSDTLQQPHKKVRLAKRGYCVFCSSKKLNKAKAGGQPQPTREGNVQQYKVTTGCSACGIALCNNSKRSCWGAWHKDLEG